MKSKFYSISKFIVCFLLCCSILTAEIITVSAQSNPPPQQSPTLSAKAQKMKKKIEKIGKGNDLTIVMENRGEYYGSILSIEDEFVLIAEVDLKKTLEVKYEEMKNVSKGYGSLKPIGGGGRRVNAGKNFLIGALITVGIILAVYLGFKCKSKTPCT